MSIEFAYTADAGKETEDRFNRLIKRLQKLFSYIEVFSFLTSIFTRKVELLRSSGIMIVNNNYF